MIYESLRVRAERAEKDRIEICRDVSLWGPNTSKLETAQEMMKECLDHMSQALPPMAEKYDIFLNTERFYTVTQEISHAACPSYNRKLGHHMTVSHMHVCSIEDLKTGEYVELHPRLFSLLLSIQTLRHGYFLRLGSHGNPSTMPLWLQREIMELRERYEYSLASYKSEHKGGQDKVSLSMHVASVHHKEIALSVAEKGGRVFWSVKRGAEEEVMKSLEYIGHRAIICPETRTKGNIQCRSCGLCSVSSQSVGPHIITPIHGMHIKKAQEAVKLSQLPRHVKKRPLMNASGIKRTTLSESECESEFNTLADWVWHSMLGKAIDPKRAVEEYLSSQRGSVLETYFSQRKQIVTDLFVYILADYASAEKSESARLVRKLARGRLVSQCFDEIMHEVEMSWERARECGDERARGALHDLLLVLFDVRNSLPYFREAERDKVIKEALQVWTEGNSDIPYSLGHPRGADSVDRFMFQFLGQKRGGGASCASQHSHIIDRRNRGYRKPEHNLTYERGYVSFDVLPIESECETIEFTRGEENQLCVIT